jgi:uncharacterized damage-inducible protein DinB
MTADMELKLDGYRYAGVRALVLLQEQELRSFVDTWKKAKKAGVTLEGFKDPNYKSMETLLQHVLWWARDYIVWSCEMLGLTDPEIDEVPEAGAVEEAAQSYLEHVLERWAHPFCELDEEPFFKPQYKTRWGIDYPVEALLEHAVVHPMRHRLQLLEMMHAVKT